MIMIDNNCDNNDIQINPYSINVSNCSKYYLAFVISEHVCLPCANTVLSSVQLADTDSVISLVLLVGPREVKLNLNPT